MSGTVTSESAILSLRPRSGSCRSKLVAKHACQRANRRNATTMADTTTALGNSKATPASIYRTLACTASTTSRCVTLS